MGIIYPALSTGEDASKAIEIYTGYHVHRYSFVKNNSEFLNLNKHGGGRCEIFIFRKNV